MQQLAELERRINAALGRIDRALSAPREGAAAGAARDGEAEAGAEDSAARIAALTAELQAERARSAALQRRLAEPARPQGDLAARLDSVTRQLDAQTLEMQRMQKNVTQLRENLRALRRAAAEKLTDPDLINRAMAAELDSVRVSRFAEMAELAGILAELEPLIAEVPQHA